ncbi:MAG: ACT domain-containing protein [Phycisphaerales bacterium]|jgi:hypothetical protein|nr:ACT domain-containing protein [Phycisphaerales bacterium]MBT7171201.1 ACT domain-containing protein [Phycisphaerales bacterium]
MQIEKQFSIFLINRPGVLAHITGLLTENGINVQALSLSDSGEHGVLRIVCQDVDKARACLTEAHDRWTETDVLVIPIDNTPGGFSRLAKTLTDGGADIAYAYFSAADDGKATTAVFKIKDLEAAKALLEG